MTLFSQTVDYALRVVLCLADADDGPMTTQVIAQITRVPTGYLAKVLQSLGQAGIVDA